jgi:S1-C subfamily serine protease
VAVAEPPSPRMGMKVRMGVMPSYAEDEKPGMAIDGVSPGGPAERAGLKEGDILLLIDDHEINDVHGLMSALAGFEPGQQAMVTLLRSGDRMKLPITFEQP